MFARGLDVGQMSAISANMADLSRYAADVGQMSAIWANMADLSRYAADVGLMSAISADMANQCRSSADVGPTCEAIWVPSHSLVIDEGYHIIDCPLEDDTRT